MKEPMYRDSVSGSGIRTGPAMQQIKANASHLMTKVTVVAMGISIGLGMVLYWILASFMDRTPPVVMTDIHTTTPVVSVGSVLHVVVTGTKTREGCLGVAKRQVLDSTGQLINISEFTTTPLPLGQRDFERDVVIPELVAPGEATYQFEISYICNWTHSLVGPVVAKAPPLKFIVVQRHENQGSSTRTKEIENAEAP